jgi:hypothetical protein
MPKLPKMPTDNKVVARLKSIQGATTDALDIFSTTVLSVGVSYPNATTAAELAQRVAEQMGKLFDALGVKAADAGAEI